MTASPKAAAAQPRDAARIIVGDEGVEVRLGDVLPLVDGRTLTVTRLDDGEDVQYPIRGMPSAHEEWIAEDDIDIATLAEAAATPAPARGEAAAMRGLVEKWRDSAKTFRDWIDRDGNSALDTRVWTAKADTMEACADALEAALPPQERTDG